MFLARFELDQERIMDEEETQHVVDDMEKRHPTEPFADSNNLKQVLEDEYAEPNATMEIKSEDFYA